MPGEWERLARHEGGTVFALATAPAQASGTHLFAATAAGLFVTTDLTRGWQAAAPIPLPLLSTVVPSAHFATNGLLFAGTQTGFYRSRDLGRTWQQTLAGGHVLAIATIPQEGRRERIFIGTEADGILRSDDEGTSWMPANPGLLDLTVLALAFSPDADHDQTGFAATASGLYRTRNGGQSWREVTLPLDEPAVQCLALSPDFAQDRTVFAGTEADGLWRSDDGGTHWQRVPGLPEGGVSAIAFSTRYATFPRIAAATTAGVACSDDRGTHWRLIGQALPPALALTFVPHGDGEILVAGLYRDGVASIDVAVADQWIMANRGLGATLLTGLIASPAFARDGTLFTTGPEAGIHVSHDGGRTWHDATGNLKDATVHRVTLSLDAAGARIAFAATDAGVFRSDNDGVHWEPASASEPSAAEIVRQAAQPPFGFGTVLPTANGEPATVTALAAAPYARADEPVFAATNAGVYRARRDGDPFEQWSEGLQLAPVLALAVTAAADGTLIVFALGIDGTIWRRVGKP